MLYSIRFSRLLLWTIALPALLYVLSYDSVKVIGRREAELGGALAGEVRRPRADDGLDSGVSLPGDEIRVAARPFERVKHLPNGDGDTRGIESTPLAEICLREPQASTHGTRHRGRRGDPHLEGRGDRAVCSLPGERLPQDARREAARRAIRRARSDAHRGQAQRPPVDVTAPRVVVDQQLADSLVAEWAW